MHNKPDLPVGTVGLKEGPLMASVDRFEITVKGKGGHAGIPDNSIDPIQAAGQIIGGLQSVVSRNISSLHNAVVSITRVQGAALGMSSRTMLKWKAPSGRFKRKRGTLFRNI